MQKSAGRCSDATFRVSALNGANAETRRVASLHRSCKPFRDVYNFLHRAPLAIEEGPAPQGSHEAHARTMHRTTYP